MDVQRKHLVVGLIPVGIAVVFLLAFSMGEVSGPAERFRTTELAPERARLVDLLGSYRRAWQPEERRSALARIRADQEILGEPMRWLFSQDSHEYLPEAVSIAGEVGLAEFRQRLIWLSLQGPPRIRPHAILAASKLGPWDPTELEELLKDTDPAVQAAAVGACAITGTRMVMAMTPLLSSEHGEVREAVVGALSMPLTEEELEILLSVALEDTGPAQSAALRVLRVNTDRPEAQAALVRLSFSEDRALASTALESLAAGSGPLRQPEEIWSQVVDSRYPLEHRALAMLCLERTRSPVAERVQRELVYLRPELKYFAGRYLVALGNREGVAVLINLLDELEFGAGDLQPKVAASLVHETRRTLALVFRQPMDASLADWRRWHEAADSLKPPPLPLPALHLGAPPSEER